MNPAEIFFDPWGIISSFSKVSQGWNQDTGRLGEMLVRLQGDMLAIQMEAWSKHSSGASDNGKNDWLSLLKQGSQLAQKCHSTWAGWTKELINATPGLDERERQRALFWAGQYLNATFPGNFIWMNPSAAQKLVESSGETLKSGFTRWLEDMCHGGTLVRLTDPKAFTLGKDIASTPGDVVFRNELIELIHYTPTVETRYAVPILLIPPWINKFYILDLTQSKSMVRFLLDQGFAVFMISWKNPGSDMRHITYQDYIFRGILEGARVATEICGVESAHAAGYCIGGTALVLLAAWLAKEGKKANGSPIAHCTLFSSLVDFSEPGELGVFIKEEIIEAIETLMEGSGFLDGKYLKLAFRLLRSDSLIWRFVANNYLQGAEPPKSDVFFWNEDATRLPASMASFYLRECYLKNNLVKKDGLTIGDRCVDIGCIRKPMYVVGPEQDHICPWKSTFRICQLIKGPARYVLSSEGHITGIVNPPSERSKRKYRAGEVKRSDRPDTWLSRQVPQQGSWWEDWLKWLVQHCGPEGKPPMTGYGAYPSLGKAPGSYVLET